MNGLSQAQHLAQNLPSGQRERTGQEPKVIFPSDLTLTQEQEQLMMQKAKVWLDNLSRDLGRPTFDCANHEPTWNVNNLKTSLPSFMGKQYFAHLMYHGKVDWRAYMDGGDSLYADTNLHIPMSRRILQQQIARAISYYTGTDPWFQCYDNENDEQDFTVKLDRWLKHELVQVSDLTAEVNTAINLAFIQGHTVLKPVHLQDVDYYETTRNVVIGADGQPVQALDGNYIFDDDLFVPLPPPPADPAAMPGTQPAMPMEAAAPTMVLKRDMETPMPPTGEGGRLVFKNVKLWRKLDKFNGVKSGSIHYLDFLCPLTAPSIEEAECCIHLYDRTVVSLAHKYQQALTGKTVSEIQPIIKELLEKIMPNSSPDTDGAGQNAPRVENGETTQGIGRDRSEPMAHLAEVWMRYDFGDGYGPRSIMLIMTKDGNTPIFYDYAANCTPDGNRPFKVVRINPVPGRWYGQGQMEVFDNLQQAVDLLINRWNFAQTRSGNVILWNPQNTMEGKDNPHLELNSGETYTPLQGKTADDILKSIPLYDIKSEEIQKLLEFLMQIAMNMSGISNVNDGAMTGLDTAKLATGVRNLERSGQELFGKFIADLTPALRALIEACADLVLTNMDQPRLFQFFEGKVGRLGTITRDEVKNVNITIRLELTKYHGEQEVAMSTAAIEAAEKFYQQPFVVQERTADLYRQKLRGFGVKNPDEIIVPTDVQAWQAQQNAMLQQQMPQPAAPAVSEQTGQPAPVQTNL